MTGHYVKIVSTMKYNNITMREILPQKDVSLRMTLNIERIDNEEYYMIVIINKI